MLSNANANQLYDKQDSRFWVKGMRGRRRTTVILASRGAPPQAAGSQKIIFIILNVTFQVNLESYDRNRVIITWKSAFKILDDNLNLSRLAWVVIFIPNFNK